ncbi:MAG: hypothetical protein V1685_07160 [Parcubacteria group bacterium]
MENQMNVETTKNKLSFLPKTKLGKWSLGLIIAMPILLMLGGLLAGSMYESVEAGNGLVDDLTKRPLLAVAALSGALAGVMAFLTGLIAIIKQKERVILVYLSTLLGALLVWFILGDVIFPGE